MGASGAGTTTLARAIATHWAVPHADADDYFWIPSDPPYVEKRPEAERVALMEKVFLPREAWVLSGSMTGWGDDVVAHCDAVVFLTLDPAERLRRLEARERVRQESSVVDEAARTAFLEWARGYDDPAFQGRSRVAHERWLSGLDCPVLRLDSGSSPEALRDAVLAWEPEIASVGERSDLFTRDARGRTKLFEAAEQGLDDVVSQMIFGLTGTGLMPQRLALIEIRDHDGLTAADVAEQHGHLAIAELLRGEQLRMEFFE